MNEQNKYETIKKLKESNGNKKRAAIELGCSLRHINRLLKGYEAQGKAFFSHGNKGRKPSLALTDKERETILLLYENKYHGSTIRHFTELLERHEDIHISEGTIRNLFLAHNILSPKAWKRTHRNLAKMLREQKLQTTSPKKEEALQAAILATEDAHPSRPRCAHAGEMIQMDASNHLWFGNSKAHLHAAIDDATGIVVGAYFDIQETLNGYYHVTQQILEQYGIPYMFYTDRRTIFEYKKKNSPKLEEDTYTQFSYACKQLGIEIKTTSIPQAKGRVERLFGTLQSRLPVEMRLAGVQTIEQANKFLNSYLKEFNAQFALPLHTTTSVFEEQPGTQKNDLLLSVLTPRTVDAGHSIRFHNSRYRMLDELGLHTNYYKGTKVLVIKTLSGKLFASVGDRIYALEEIPYWEEVSRNFNTSQEIADSLPAKKQYIPPVNHPWRNDNFMKHVHAMTGKEAEWAL